MQPDSDLAALTYRLARLEGELATRRDRARRRVMARIALGVAVVCLLPSPSHAIVIPTDDIATDQPISATAMVERFEAIASAINSGQRICLIATEGEPLADCDWIANVTDTGPGTWEITFADSTFPTTPMCFCGAPQTGVWCDTIDSDDVSVVVETMNGAATPYETDSGIRLLCVTEP